MKEVQEKTNHIPNTVNLKGKAGIQTYISQFLAQVSLFKIPEQGQKVKI